MTFSEVKDPNLPLVPTDLTEPSTTLDKPSVDSDFVGLDINEFATKNALDPDEVWQKIRVGELLARSQMGKIFVYEKTSKIARVIAESDILDPDNEASSPSQTLLSPQLLRTLAQDLHREKQSMLALTQQTIQKMNAMSQQLLTAKDNLLNEKEKVIQQLEERLKILTEENNSLSEKLQNQQNETDDLRMLQSIIESM